MLDLLTPWDSGHLLQSCFFPRADPSLPCWDYSIPDARLHINFFLSTRGSSLPISLACPDVSVCISSMLAAPHDIVLPTNLQRGYSPLACIEHYHVQWGAPFGTSGWTSYCKTLCGCDVFTHPTAESIVSGVICPLLLFNRNWLKCLGCGWLVRWFWGFWGFGFCFYFLPNFCSWNQEPSSLTNFVDICFWAYLLSDSLLSYFTSWNRTKI